VKRQRARWPDEKRSRNFKNYAKAKPELARLYGLRRLAIFGSYARADQREESEVDILVKIEHEIGLFR